MAELYRFTNGLQSIGFSPHLLSETWGGLVYTAASISRSALTLSGNLVKSQVTFTMPSTNAFGRRRVFDLPGEGWGVEIFEDKVLLWTGRVINATLSGTKITITTDSTERTDSRNPTGARFALHCWKTLYSPTCGADKNLRKVTLPVTVSGKFLTLVTPVIPNLYAGGLVEKLGESRKVVRNTDLVLEMSSAFSTDAAVAGNADLFPGCNLTSSACLGFANILNFGGFEHIPLTNPMERTGLL